MACPKPTMPTNIVLTSAMGHPAEICLAAGKCARSACDRSGSTMTVLNARSEAAEMRSDREGSGALKDLKAGGWAVKRGADDSGEACHESQQV